MMNSLMPENIGLFGGSFNPPNTAHVILARWVQKYMGFDELWLMVSPHNPLKNKDDLAPFAHRLKMAQLAWQGDENIRVSDFEETRGTRRTYDTLQKLREEFPHTRFSLIFGQDNWEIFHKWYKWEEILKTIPILILARPGNKTTPEIPIYSQVKPLEISDKKTFLHAPSGWMMLENDLYEGSSTLFRRNKDFSLLPREVTEYIKTHKLYGIL